MQTQFDIVNLRKDTNLGTIEKIKGIIAGGVFEKHYNDLVQLYNREHRSSPKLLKFLTPTLENKCNFKVYSKNLPKQLAKEFLVEESEIIMSNGQPKRYFMNSLYRDLYGNLIVNLELMAGRGWENRDYIRKLLTIMIKYQCWVQENPNVIPVLVLAVPNKYTYGKKSKNSPFELINGELRVLIKFFIEETLPNIILIGYGERI